MRISIFCISILSTLLFSCVDVINLDLPEKDKRLVIEGLITDWDTVYTIRLTKTTKYNYKINNATETENGATVVISDNAGKSDTLLETQSGIYRTNPNHIRGTIGLSYKLDIYTLSGKHYISIPEVLTEAPKIDSLYFEKDYKDKYSDYAFKNYVYLDWKDPAGIPNYYLHHMSYYWGNTWHTENEWSSIATDNTFDGKYLKKYLISSEYDGYNFFIRVTRYSLSKKAFEFWDLLNQQLYPRDDGIVNSNVPLLGNVYNADNPDDFTLGYFQVSGKTVSQVYVDR